MTSSILHPLFSIFDHSSLPQMKETCMRSYVKFLPLALLLFLGCESKSYKSAPVSGRVIMDDRPLAEAEVRFTPTDNTLPYSVGVTDDQGNYELHLFGKKDSPGAVLGEHRVSISMDLRRDKRKAKMLMESGGRMQTRPGELIPAQYNAESKLTCTVPPDGKSDANFDLKSKGETAGPKFEQKFEKKKH
jgi:hypothetical protein